MSTSRDVSMIALGVASILAGIVQRCLAHALFDIADAALRHG